MNPIDALNLSFYSSVTSNINPSNKKTETTSAKETVNFAVLFGSVTAEGEIGSEKTESEAQQGELEKLLKKLDEVIEVLKELPQEEFSQEEQDIMYTIVHALALQTTQIKDKLQETGLTKEKGMTLSPTLEKLMLTSPVQKNLLQIRPLQEELMTILHKLNQDLQELSVVHTIQFEKGPKFVGVEGKDVSSDPRNSEQVFKKLVTFIQQFESGLQALDKPISFQQKQQIQQIEQIYKQLTSLTQGMENHTQVTESQQKNVLNLETTPPVPIISPFKQQEGGGLPSDSILPEESSQANITGLAQQHGAKSSQASIRPDVSTQTPTVRMTNIIEELGEVLRGTFRLSGIQAGTQIRVNIFPEHLGHLDILLSASNGKITAQIFTSNIVAKEALDLQVNQLRNSLLQQGLAIDKIEISHNTSQQTLGHQNAQPDQRFSQHQQKQGNASRDKNGYHRMEEEEEFERNQSVDGLIKVDYTV